MEVHWDASPNRCCGVASMVLIRIALRLLSKTTTSSKILNPSAIVEGEKYGFRE